jgi:hypothetical protein
MFSVSPSTVHPWDHGKRNGEMFVGINVEMELYNAWCGKSIDHNQKTMTGRKDISNTFAIIDDSIQSIIM